MANQDQLKLLQQGVSAWNTWRENKAPVRPVSRLTQPFGENLDGDTLEEADLSGADLKGANLKAANLNRANLIVDITNPRSAPLELQATVPEYMIPFVPIIERGEEPFAMFRDLWIKHREWVLDPIRYPSVERLVEVLDTEIIAPAQARFADLLARKAEQVRIKDV